MGGARPHQEPGPGRLPFRAGLATAVSAAVACGLLAFLLLPSVSPPPRAPGAADAGTLPAGAAPAPADTALADTAPAHSPPVTLTVPGHLDATPVDPVAAATDGSLNVPPSPSRLGWWALGARPGAPRGTLLLAGHLDSADEGPGPFEALHAVPLGTRAQVAAADGTRHTYTIVARRTYKKSALPQDLFTAHGPPRLALVTCAGDFDPDARAYTENLVLYGTRVRDTNSYGPVT